MSLPELADSLVRSLRTSTALLQRLAQGLRDRRTQWISARPSVLAEPVDALESLTAQLTEEDGRRDAIVGRIRAAFPARLGAAGPLHVNASLLKDHVGTATADRLQKAARESTEAAAAVRREIALGQRLLRFTQHAHEALLDGVGECIARTKDDVGSYDRNARRVQAALPRTGSMPGSIVDGRI